MMYYILFVILVKYDRVWSDVWNDRSRPVSRLVVYHVVTIETFIALHECVGLDVVGGFLK